MTMLKRVLPTLGALAILGLLSDRSLRYTPTPTPAPAVHAGAASDAPGSDAGAPSPGLIACFAPGTPDDVMASVTRALEPALRSQLANRWSRTAVDGAGLSLGQPTVITYSFMPDGTSIPDRSGLPGGSSDLVAFLDGIYGSPDVWQPIFAQVFERWGALSGLTYVFEPNDDGAASSNANSGVVGVRGDVRIGGVFLDGPNNVLAYNLFPNDGDMVIDTGDTFFANTANASLRLRNVVAHEHGHGLGFFHVCPLERTKLMEPIATTMFDGPQHDDIRAAQRFYGDPFEPDDIPEMATDLGVLSPGATLIPGQVPAPSVANGSLLSIDGAGEADWFRFTTSAPVRLSVTLEPVGLNYDDSPQSCVATGSCCTGNFTDSRSIADLTLELFDASESSLQASDFSPAGAGESLQDVFLTEPGDYLVRVSANAGAADAQLYDLSISAVALPFIPAVVTFPQGVPTELAPGQPTTFPVAIEPNQETITTVVLRSRASPGAPLATSVLTQTTPGVYEATLPPFDCADEPGFFVTVNATMSGVRTFPPQGDAAPHRAVVGSGATPFDDHFESDLGWSVASTPDGTGTFDGAWERGTPVGGGDRGDPPNDFDASGDCFLTANRDGNSDVDAGATTLTSPAIDLAGLSSATLTYARWFSNVGGQAPEQDVLVVEVSDDNGASWSPLETVGPALDSTEGDVAGGWVLRSFDIGRAVELTDAFRVRFIVEDADPGSIVEAAIDAVRVQGVVCQPAIACPADWNQDGFLNDQDFFDWSNDFFSQNGPRGSFDFNGDGFQNDQDFFDFANAFFAQPAAQGC